MKVQLRVICLAALVAPGCKPRVHPSDGSGTIECTEVRVAPEVAGRILALSAEEGSHLKKGDVLARIDPEAYQLRLDEARAVLAQAQAQFDLMTAGFRDQDIRRAQEQVYEAEAAAEAAQADLERTRVVFEKQSVTPKQMDDARAKARQTGAALAGTEQVLDKMRKGNREEEIRMAGATVDAARARVALAEKALADTTVIAPMDGVVTAKNLEVGDYAPVGSTLVTLSRLDEVWLSIYVPGPSLGQVKLGGLAYVIIDGDPTPYQGRVTFVSPQAEFTPRNVQTPDERAKLVYRVKITVPNPDGVFKPGMPADGYLESPP